MHKRTIEKLKSFIKEAESFIPDTVKQVGTPLKLWKMRYSVYEAYTTSVLHHLGMILNKDGPYFLGYRKYCLRLEPDTLSYCTEILKRIVVDFEDGSLGVSEVVAARENVEKKTGVEEKKAVKEKTAVEEKKAAMVEKKVVGEKKAEFSFPRKKNGRP